jgi:hypothetical protein
MEKLSGNHTDRPLTLKMKSNTADGKRKALSSSRAITETRGGGGEINQTHSTPDNPPAARAYSNNMSFVRQRLVAIGFDSSA